MHSMDRLEGGQVPAASHSQRLIVSRATPRIVATAAVRLLWVGCGGESKVRARVAGIRRFACGSLSQPLAPTPQNCHWLLASDDIQHKSKV
jgi:hypothetical protein